MYFHIIDKINNVGKIQFVIHYHLMIVLLKYHVDQIVQVKVHIGHYILMQVICLKMVVIYDDKNVLNVQDKHKKPRTRTSNNNNNQQSTSTINKNDPTVSISDQSDNESENSHDEHDNNPHIRMSTSSSPTHISLNNSTVTINHFTSPIPKLLSTNENVYHQQNGNGVLISPTSKQHEACQSVPRSPQHRHQLYSNEQQQQFISNPHNSLYLDLQPFPSNSTPTNIPYSNNGTSTATNYYTTESSSSSSSLHPQTSSAAYYFTSYPSTTNNNVIDYQQPVRL